MEFQPSAGFRHDQPILRFEACTLPLAGTAGEVFDVDLTLHAGELAILQTEDGLHEAAVSRAACGLLAPVAGRVRFLGRDWHGLSPDWANASRGRIGTVFRDESWVPYLPLMENIILPQLHHTRRPEEEVSREAAHWAARFGLPGLPRDLPAAVSAPDRQAANLVRAFIGKPSLIVVEHLPVSPSAGMLQTLVNAMREARERGTAVLWLTQEMTLARNESIPATQHLRIGATWQASAAQAAPQPGMQEVPA